MEEAPVATGMTLGAHVSGDLIIEATTDNGPVLVRLPHAWLHAEGGVRHFIESECHPNGPVPDCSGEHDEWDDAERCGCAKKRPEGGT